MTRHLGNLTVTAQNAGSFPDVTEIYGHLTVGPGVYMAAPRLALVRGWLTLAGGILHAPLLRQVDGWLTLSDGAQFGASNLSTVTHDLIVGVGTVLGTPKLSMLGGLVLQRNGRLHLAGLQGVRGNVAVQASAELECPALTNIGQSITLKEHAVFDAPVLGHIGAYYDGDETAVLRAPRFMEG